MTMILSFVCKFILFRGLMFKAVSYQIKLMPWVQRKPQ